MSTFISSPAYSVFCNYCIYVFYFFLSSTYHFRYIDTYFTLLFICSMRWFLPASCHADGHWELAGLQVVVCPHERRALIGCHRLFKQTSSQTPPPPPAFCWVWRVRIVSCTGSNTGIGKATALDLARRGARVVLACRSKERAEAAVFDIRQVSLRVWEGGGLQGGARESWCCNPLWSSRSWSRKPEVQTYEEIQRETQRAAAHQDVQMGWKTAAPPAGWHVEQVIPSRIK